MIKFRQLPATPGSIEPTPELVRILTEGSVPIEELHDHNFSGAPYTAKSAGRSIGVTVLINIEPPTAARVVEVLQPIVNSGDFPLENKISFMSAALAAAMEHINEGFVA